MAISTDPSVWVAALLTIMAYTILYKDNPFYKLAEHILVGLSAGYLFIQTWKMIYNSSLLPLFNGSGLLFGGITLVLGVLLFTKFSKKYFWLSNISIAVLVGTATGLTVRGYLFAQLIEQVKASIVVVTALQPLDIFNSVLSLIMVVCTLAYFLFTFEQKGALGWIAKFGRYTMMAAFGAAYGGTVMTRLTIFIQRMQYLLFTWLGLA
jgi:hypothetical protein